MRVSQITTVVRHSAFALACLLLAAPAVRAQGAIEASIEGGYTASEGITGDEHTLLGAVYNSLDITSGGSWGFTVGAFVTEHVELEFLYSRQFSTLQISDPAPARKISNQNVDNYHGNFVYNWGDADTQVRPFFFLGFGATHYLPGEFDPSLPNSGAVSEAATETKFSTTWGGGVKVYPNKHIGFKATARWTPTFIKSDAEGIWCDPYWFPSCWVIENYQYANQFAFTGGVTFKFGGL